MSRECQRSVPRALRGIRMVRGSTFLIPTDHMETLVATNLSLNSNVRFWPIADIQLGLGQKRTHALQQIALLFDYFVWRRNGMNFSAAPIHRNLSTLV